MAYQSYIIVGVLVTLNAINFDLPRVFFLLRLFGIIPNYNDFSVMYYQETFPSVVITMTILIVSPFFLNCLDIFIKFLKRIYDQKWWFNRQRTR